MFCGLLNGDPPEMKTKLFPAAGQIASESTVISEGNYLKKKRRTTYKNKNGTATFVLIKKNVTYMIQHFIVRRKEVKHLMLLAGALLLGLSSCIQREKAPECYKCIEHKPKATGFSRKLNAINHSISIPKAVSMIDNFATWQDSMLQPKYRRKNILPVYETFNLQIIDSLICQKNAVGFRVYMAMDDQQQARFVLVGVDGDGNDILQNTKNDTKRSLLPAPGNPGNPGTPTSGNGGSVIVAEAGQRWP